jgi:hypothetical protein
MDIIKTAFLATFYGLFAILCLAVPGYLVYLGIIGNITGLFGTFAMFFVVLVVGMCIEQYLQ